MMRDERIWLAVAAMVAGIFVMAREIGETLGDLPGQFASAPPSPDALASAALRDALLGAFSRRGYDPEEVIRAIGAESGWRPHAVGRVDGRPVAAGLIQMTDASLRANGWDAGVEAFAGATEATQWPTYQRFIGRMPRARRPGDARLALFWPVAVRDDWPDERVIASVVSIGFPAKVWEQNPTLREGYPAVPMGPITAGSVRATVRAPGPVSP